MKAKITNQMNQIPNESFALGTFVSVHLAAGWWILEKELGEPVLTIPVNYFLWEAAEFQAVTDGIDAIAALEKWGRPFQLGATDLSDLEEELALEGAIVNGMIPDEVITLKQAREVAAREFLESPTLPQQHGVTDLAFEELLSRLYSPQEVVVRLQTMTEMSVAARNILEGLPVDYESHGLQVINRQLSVYAPAISNRGITIAGTPNVCSEMALQIFQTLEKGLKLKSCENQSCGREFVLQRGRSNSSIHRTTDAIRFCSHNCAKTQSQRNRRARN